MDKKMKLSVNLFDSHVLESRPEYELLADHMDYAFCHFDPGRRSVEEDAEKAAKLAARFAERDLDFVANFEFQNFAVDTSSEDGWDWSNRRDGTHRLNLPPQVVAAFASQGNLIAVAHDEFEHAILNRNISLWMATKGRVDKPVFPQPKTRDAFRQGEYLAAQLKAYADGIREMGAPAVAGEHVFPVLYHMFARCGIIPNFKSQKEGYSNLQFAIAAGAALEYGTPLWTCVDMWHKMTYPGHSPEELFHNLQFAYHAGVDRAYVEADTALVRDGRFTEYGEVYMRFAADYRGRDRAYNVSDYLPEIGIIRYDDTYWGQNLVWDKGLFGNRMIRPTKENREWIGILDLLTFGESGSATFTWNRISPSSLLPHKSFCSMNALAVFDDRVRAASMQSLKLAFLCGLRISPETLRDVEILVRENGLTAVCPGRLAPARFRNALNGGYTEILDGKGRWIVTEDWNAPRLKKRIAPFLGEKGEIRLPFRGAEVRLRIGDKGETFVKL